MTIFFLFLCSFRSKEVVIFWKHHHLLAMKKYTFGKYISKKNIFNNFTTDIASKKKNQLFYLYIYIYIKFFSITFKNYFVNIFFYHILHKELNFFFFFLYPSQSNLLPFAILFTTACIIYYKLNRFTNCILIKWEYIYTLWWSSLIDEEFFLKYFWVSLPPFLFITIKM